MGEQNAQVRGALKFGRLDELGVAPRQRFRARESGILLFTVYLVLFLYWYTGETFWTTQNLLNIARNVSFVAIMAIGQAMVVITGGIDLSVGSVSGLAGLVAGVILNYGYRTVTAVAAALAAGVAAGGVNGFFVTRIKMPPFVPTLGMLSLARGLAFVLTQGRSVSYFGPATDGFRTLGAGELAGMPTPIIFMIALAAAGWVLLARTEWGYRLYAIGGNEEAARLAGIAIGPMKFLVYVLSDGNGIQHDLVHVGVSLGQLAQDLVTHLRQGPAAELLIQIV